MPDKSEVIMGHMDETRKDLADKLGQLEKKVTDTVGSVTHLVESVPGTVESVRESIQETVATVTDTVQDTLGAVQHGVAETVHSVQNFFDLPRQVNRHPWLMLGGSVLLGYLGGRLLLPRRRATDQAPEMSAMSAASAYTPAYSASAPTSGTSNWSGAAASESAPTWQGSQEKQPSGSGWLSRLTEHFGGEINKVKGLALGTLLGVARDMITRAVPETLRRDVTEVINNFTSDLGGKVFQEPVLGQQASSPAGQESSPQTDDAPHAAGGQEAYESDKGSSRGTTSRRGGSAKR